MEEAKPSTARTQRGVLGQITAVSGLGRGRVEGLSWEGPAALKPPMSTAFRSISLSGKAVGADFPLKVQL